jgi:hypothetical protein
VAGDLSSPRAHAILLCVRSDQRVERVSLRELPGDAAADMLPLLRRRNSDGSSLPALRAQPLPCRRQRDAVLRASGKREGRPPERAGDGFIATPAWPSLVSRRGSDGAARGKAARLLN